MSLLILIIQEIRKTLVNNLTSIFSIQGAVVLFVMSKNRFDKLENYTEKGLKLTKKVENG